MKGLGHTSQTQRGSLRGTAHASLGTRRSLAWLVLPCLFFSLACGDRRRAVEANNRGYVLLSQKRFAEAMSAFDQAVGADASLAEAHLGLGRAYDETQQFDKAEQSLRKYTTLRPGDGDGHYYLGLVLVGKKQDAEAMKSFRTAAEATPTTPRTHLAYYRLGRVQNRLGQVNDAAEAFRQSIRKRPSFLRAYEELASTYADSGDLASAEQALRNAIATKLPDPHVHSSLGLIYSRMADRIRDESARNLTLERAATEFVAATVIKPSYARAYWNLGMTLAKVMKDQKPAKRKDAMRYLQLFLARHGKEDELTTQANDMIQHLSE